MTGGAGTRRLRRACLAGAGALLTLLLLTACTGTRHATETGRGPGDRLAAAGGTPPFPCTGWVRRPTDAFDRAGAGARRFGSVRPGDPVAVVGRNAAGWWAFAPGTAQAANVGPFRWRWLPPDTRLRLQGACSALPTRASPPPGVCFEMAMAATPIRAAPAPDARQVASLPAGGYVAVTGRSATGWLKVDAASGSAPGSGSGWIEPAAVNVNGPCDAYVHAGP